MLIYDDRHFKVPSQHLGKQKTYFLHEILTAHTYCNILRNLERLLLVRGHLDSSSSPYVTTLPTTVDRLEWFLDKFIIQDSPITAHQT